MNVGACGASFDKTFTTALAGGENRQTGPSARLMVSRRCCHKHRLPEMPSTHSAPSSAGGKVVAPATKGGAAGMVQEIYGGNFSHTFLFSLEVKVCSTFILLHSYVLSSITMISRLRRLFPPLVPYGTTFLLKGSMSLDFRVTTFPCKSSSFATPLCGAQQPAGQQWPHKHPKA